MQIDDNDGPQPPDDHADDITEQKVHNPTFSVYYITVTIFKKLKEYIFDM